MGKPSRDKGKRGEREVAKLLRDKGLEDARRNQQFCGKAGDADVVGLPGFHVEVKRVERFELRKALQQASDDARDGEIPIVFQRGNCQEWVVVLKADDFLDLVDWESMR